MLNTNEFEFETFMAPTSAVAAGEDTLGLEDFSSTVQVVYDLGGGGYFFGTYVEDTVLQGFPTQITNNAFGRGFIVNDPYIVTGAMLWFALKSGVNASPADITVSVHDLANNISLLTANSDPQNPDGSGPGTELASTTVAFDDINTSTVGAPTFAFFGTPVSTVSDLAVVANIEGLYATEVDTAVLFNESSGTGVADGEYSWILQNAAVSVGGQTQDIPLWLANSAYDLESDIAIFAIVEETTDLIEEQGFMNGVKMTTYPNPAVSSESLTVQYGLENVAEKVEINIFDMNGKLVHTIVEGDKAAGIHNVNVPAGTLSAGSYVYSIQANSGRMAKRLEVLK